MIVEQFYQGIYFVIYYFSERGKISQSITRDHKPMDEIEQKRILAAGGKIYQTATPIPASCKGNGIDSSDVIIGPHRVLPGRLSVSRTFGDPEAKLQKYGGNPNVVVAIPDITSFHIENKHDFIVMGSDGIFDKLSTEDVVKCVWNNTTQERASTVHEVAGITTDAILKNSLLRRSYDNVTVVMIAFPNFKINSACNEKLCQTARPDRSSVIRSNIKQNEQTRQSTQRNRSEDREKSKKFVQNSFRKSELPAKHSSNASMLCRLVPQTARNIKMHFDFHKIQGDHREQAHKEKSALSNTII